MGRDHADGPAGCRGNPVIPEFPWWPSEVASVTDREVPKKPGNAHVAALVAPYIGAEGTGLIGQVVLDDVALLDWTFNSSRRIGQLAESHSHRQPRSFHTFSRFKRSVTGI